MDLGAGSATAPAKVLKKKTTKKKAKKKKVALRCLKYKGKKGHRKCVKYQHRKKKSAKKSAVAHAAQATSVIVNPGDCTTGSWTIQLQTGFKDGIEEREAAAPCVAAAR